MGGTRARRCSRTVLSYHIALKAHEYKLAADTLDKILNIDPNADLEQIVAGISPESAADRADLLNILNFSKEKNNPSVLY